MVVSLEIRNGRAIDNVNRISRNFPVAVRKAVDDFGFSLQRRLKRNVTAQGLTWRGKLHKGIRWDVKRKELRMPVHGVYVDSMRPHFVKLKKGRLISQWARTKGNLDVRVAAAEEKSIFVRPHPFIKAPVERTLADLPSMIKRRTSKLVQTRGRSV